MTSMPRARPIWQIFFTGKICPVRFVMWQMWITLVRGVIACSMRLARSSCEGGGTGKGDRKSTRLNSSHTVISYAVFCLKKKNNPWNLDALQELERESGRKVCTILQL